MVRPGEWLLDQQDHVALPALGEFGLAGFRFGAPKHGRESCPAECP